MFGRLLRRDPESDAIASTLYGAIVAQARQPVLYTGFGVPDTVDGRFEMVVLHAIIVLDRLQSGGEAEKAMGQKVFDLHCTDMDQSLRELGIGDLAVPKRMKKMAASFYGRAGAYRPALVNKDIPALADAIERNVFGRASPGAAPLAAYAFASWDAFVAWPATTLLSEPLHFADPAAFAPSGAMA